MSLVFDTLEISTMNSKWKKEKASHLGTCQMNRKTDSLQGNHPTATAPQIWLSPPDLSLSEELSLRQAGRSYGVRVTIPNSDDPRDYDQVGPALTYKLKEPGAQTRCYLRELEFAVS